jgi:YD repeat-containing protein
MSGRTRDEQNRVSAISSWTLEVAQLGSAEFCSETLLGFFQSDEARSGQTSSRRRVHSVVVFLLVILWITMGTLAGKASAQTPNVSYVYDSVGRLVAVYDASGNAAVYSYDLVGNLLSVTRYAANQPASFYVTSSSGQPGATISIYGTDFCSDPVVTFNGVAATVVSSSSTQIVVTVPSGATAGEIVVTCGSNSINAGPFSPGSSLAPSISGFSPASGGPGRTVTIAGSGFQPNSIAVTFNNTGALVLSATSSTITAIVPGNATSGPIAVSDSYGQAVTGSNFGVLPAGTVYVANLSAGGSPTPVSFDAGGQQALFTFNGTAGEHVLISFDDPQVDCMSTVTVNNPDGSTLGTFDDLCNGVGFLEEALPATGVYSIFANDGFDPGSLSVSLANIAQLPTISVGGSAVNVNIPVGTTSALAFQGNSGDQLSLSASFAAIGEAFPLPAYPNILLVAPDGSTLGTAIWTPWVNWEVFSNWSGFPSEEYLDSITLTQTGTYLIVNESSSEDIANNNEDQFPLQLNSAPPISGTIAVGGPSVTLTPVPGQAAELTFSGSAGQTISFGYTTLDYPVNVTGTNPDGSQLWTSSLLTEIYYEYYAHSSGSFLAYSPAIELPESGTYQIGFDFLGQTQPVVVNLYDATPEGSAISVGGPSVAVSTGPGQVDNLSFAGQAGQQVSFSASSSTYVVQNSSSHAAQIAFQNPDGSYLNSFSFQGPVDSSGGFSLPQTGNYTVQISGFYSEPGTLNLQLYDATPVNGGSISIGGSPISMSTNPGQPLELSLTGTAGQQSSLEISNSSYATATVSVFNPDGSSLESGSLISGSQGWAQIPSLPTTGVYTIEVVGDGGPGAASLQLFSSNQEDFTTSIGGPPVDVTLQGQVQSADIIFNANAGQWISLATSNSTLDGCAEIELLNPDGSWANAVYACDPSDVMYATQLTQSGTYSIFVDGQGSTGDIDVQVLDATPVTGTISIDGSPVVPTMSEPSQNFEYTFSGTAGQEIGLGVTNFSSYADCSPEIYILDPNGNYVDGQILNPSYWPDGTASLGNGNDILSVDGTYSIFLDDTGCSSGTAEIALFTSNTESGAISFNGDTVNAPSTLPGQPIQLSISGGAGQTVYLNTSNSTYQDCVNIVLNDPTSSVVDDLWQCGDTGTMGPDTLSSDGYTIWVYPLGEAGSIDLSLSSQ